MAHQNSWTLDAGVGHWTLDAGLWTLDSGRWTLDSGRWTLPLTIVEQNQKVCLIKLLETLLMRTSKDHVHACSVETIGSDVAIFRNSILTLSVTF